MMPDTRAWTELHRTRFTELPEDCGNRADPGIIYSEDLRDWSDKATTPDQARIERYIDHFDLREKRVLHIGVGNSGLASRFHKRVGEIVGTTIDQPEADVARELGLPNYHVVLHNKYSGHDDVVPGRFDFIVDNNPTSPCCCLRHLADLFDFYVAKLSDGGQVVTDREGLEWIPEGSNPQWSFDFDDLAAAAQAAGLSAWRIDRNVHVLSHGAPAKPALAPRLRYGLRRLRTLPVRAIRSGPRRLVGIIRKLKARF